MAQQQEQMPQPQMPPVPPTLTLPAGTLIVVRSNAMLSSDRNKAGDAFTATLDQPLVANGWVVARHGQLLNGQVVSAKKSGFWGGNSELGVTLTEVTLADGQVIPIQTSLVQSSMGTPYGRDTAVIGGTSALGAAAGAVAGGGPGAAIGAGAGAAAGVLGVLSTHDRPTIVFPEAQLTFRLQAPVTISTVNGGMAFGPVGPTDYSGDQGQNGNGQMSHRPAYPGYGYGYGPYYYGYGPYPYAYPYPYYYGPGFVGPFVGFGGVFVFHSHPGFRGGFRR